MDYFGYQLAELLALQGIPPDLICKTLTTRMREYGQYQKWFPDKNEGPVGTLFWEASKHIGSSLNLDKNPPFMMSFIVQATQLRSVMLIEELLTGRA